MKPNRPEVIQHHEIEGILTSGKFVTVTFRKKGGELRTLTGRAKVSRYVKGQGMSYNYHDRGMVLLWESTKSKRRGEKDVGYRLVTLSRVISITANKRVYVVDRIPRTASVSGRRFD